MDSGGRLARRIVAVALSAAAFSCSAGVAGATAPAWLPAQRIEPGQSSINGASCPSTTTCVAAAASPVIQDGGPSYEPATDPDPGAILNAVSCAPATRVCMFVDSNGGAFSYDSGAFSARSSVDGTTEFESVSCPTATFCMAIDHNDKVFKFSNGSWDGGTSLTQPSNYSNFTSVSCSAPAFCVALASSSGGERYYTWDGSSWTQPTTLFDATGGYVVSLSCTSSTFCLATDEAGNASVFNGSAWATQSVDTPMNITTPKLYSSCVGTSCVAVDFYDNAFATSDGTTWTPNSPANIHDGTGISGVTTVACASATLCVAGDGLGDATTYAIPPAPGNPALIGTPTTGQTLSLSHATVATPSAWYYDDWRRCDNPDAGCTFAPISTSDSSYTLAAADVGKYIDVRELVGFGFDEEGPLLSNIVGPINDGSATSGGAGGGGTSTTTPTTTTPTTTSTGSTAPAGSGSATLAGAQAVTRGVVTIRLSCGASACSGSIVLRFKKLRIGTAKFSLAAGSTGKIKVKLTAAGKKVLKQHGGKLQVTLTIVSADGRQRIVKLTLKLGH